MKKNEKSEKRRLKLMESYGGESSGNGAFSDQRLEEITSKIKKISSPKTVSDQLPDSLTDPSPDAIPDPPSNNPVRQTNLRPVRRTIDHPVNNPDNYPDGTPLINPDNYPGDYPSGDFFDSPVWSITNKQAQVLTFLIQRRNGIAQRREVCQATGITEGTVKHSIKILSKYRFISKPKLFHQGRFRGFKYSINEALCKRFIEERLNGSIDCPDNCTVDDLTDQLSNRSTDSYISSSSLLNKHDCCEIQTTLTNHPELGYWRQKGLTAKQIELWVQLAQCDLETMIQYLCYCRFEMVDLDVEKSKPVDNVMNWFFRILERTRGYPKPKGYKSYQQKQIEVQIKLAEQAETEAQALKDAIQRRYKAEQDKKFYAMLDDRESELHKRCFERLSAFGKRQRPIKPGDPIKPSFESAMRKVFDELEEGGGASEK